MQGVYACRAMSPADLNRPVSMADFEQVRRPILSQTGLHVKLLRIPVAQSRTCFKRVVYPMAQALRRINSSVSTTDVKRHLAYMKEFGSV